MEQRALPAPRVPQEIQVQRELQVLPVQVAGLPGQPARRAVMGLAVPRELPAQRAPAQRARQVQRVQQVLLETSMKQLLLPP